MRPTTQTKAPIDVQMEKEVFLEVWLEFVDAHQPSTFVQVWTIPEGFEKLIRKPQIKKVSKLKEFFKSYLALIHDKDAIVGLATLIEETPDDMQHEKRVNHIGKRLKLGREQWMTAQIGDYDMEYIILDLGFDVNILTRKTWESMNNQQLD